MFDFSQLHFLRPWAFLLFIPAFLLWWFYRHRNQLQSGWAQLIDQHLLQWIMPNSESHKSSQWRNLYLALFWLIAVVALSGPSWTKLPQPTFSSQAAHVIVLDLSLSMDAQDVQPSRLARAKFKISDLLKNIKDGQTGLVVYAGDAFILSPLTTDGKTIENLVAALSTNLMPIMGSKPQLGIEQAVTLLKNAGKLSGDIIWITDGLEASEQAAVKDVVVDNNFGVKILAIGSAEGSPIKLPGGVGFLKDNRNNIVIPKLNYNELAEFAKQINATLTPVTADDGDIKLLSETSVSSIDEQFEKQDIFADSWHDAGYWLILLLLPLVLLSFKHKNLLGCGLVFVMANMMLAPNASANMLEDLFLNKNQQAQKHMQQQEFDQAYDKFEDPNWKAAAAYKKGDFNTFASSINEPVTADEHYNRGNALTQLERYDEAINAYDKALEIEPDMADAKANKAIAEQLKAQKEQQEQEKNDSEQDGDQKEEQNQQQQEQDQQQQSESDSESEQEQESQQQQQAEQQQQNEISEQDRQAQFQEEEKDQELEQWLRRIPDDPGGLLRRKMYQEYRRRGANRQVDQSW